MHTQHSLPPARDGQRPTQTFTRKIGSATANIRITKTRTARAQVCGFRPTLREHGAVTTQRPWHRSRLTFDSSIFLPDSMSIHQAQLATSGVVDPIYHNDIQPPQDSSARRMPIVAATSSTNDCSVHDRAHSLSHVARKRCLDEPQVDAEATTPGATPTLCTGYDIH